MKPNKLVISIITFLGFNAFAYDYKVTCHEKKMTKFENISVNQSSDECKAFLSNGYTTCFDSKKRNSSSELITLSTPNDHYYQSKESNRYSRKRIQAIINSAIKAGNDPYLTLAIVLTENPPVLNVSKQPSGEMDAASYATTYGNIPLDAIAVADSMGCDREKTGYASNGLIQVKSSTENKMPTLVDDPKGNDHIVCMNSSFVSGEAVMFYKPYNNLREECCIMVKAQNSGFVREPDRANPGRYFVYPNDDLRVKLLDLLAHKYMKSRFASAANQVPFKRPEEKMAYIAQSFNGHGRLGSTESVRNKCLSGIHMGKTPVYGAGTSEIMINSLMNNSEIQNMVTGSLTAQKKAHPESYLCRSYGSGTHSVEGYAFTDLLGTYLGERKGCADYTNKIKNLKKFVKAQPVSATPTIAPSADDEQKSNSEGIAN